ncbi:unnamed protein product, partial [Ilex paraguariensis]
GAVCNQRASEQKDNQNINHMGEEIGKAQTATTPMHYQQNNMSHHRAEGQAAVTGIKPKKTV